MIRPVLGRITAVCFVAALSGGSMWAQASSDWLAVGRTPAISPGVQLEVRTTGNKRYRGQFTAVENDTLILSTGRGEQRLIRTDVSRLSVKKAGHRGRNTLIGMGIGAAAGLTLGAVADARCTGKCIEGSRPLGKEVGTPLGALIGTIIGAILPTGGWKEVYRAP